jgi:hypothetical protein
MNIVKLQNELKNVPDQALIGYVQNPTGQVPTYLALSELQRRKEMREKYQSAKPEKTTVAEDLTPAPQQGIAAIQQPTQAPVAEQGVAGLPVPDQMFSGQGMAAGGIVAFDDGGEVATSRFGDWMRGLGNVGASDIDRQIGTLQREKAKYQSNIFTPKTESQKVNEAARIKEIDSQIAELSAQRNKSSAPATMPGANVPGSQAAADALIRGSLGDQTVNPFVPPQAVPVADAAKTLPTFEGVSSALPKAMSLDEAIKREKDAYSKMGVDPEFYSKQTAKIQEERDALKGEKSQAGWMALAKAGLGMAAGKSPYALQNIATGAMQGVEQYGIDTKDLRKEQNLLKASDQKLAEAQYLQSRGDAQGAIKAMDEREKLIINAQQHRDTINAHIQAAKIGASSRSGIDEDTIAKGFAKAVENGEYKNTQADYQKYKSLFTGTAASASTGWGPLKVTN